MIDQELEALRNVFGGAIGEARLFHGNEIYLDVQVGYLPPVSHYISRVLGGTLVSVVGTDEREIDRKFRLYYFFSIAGKDRFMALRAELDADRAEYPSVAALLPAAAWYERENQDFLGLKPVGHPWPHRLVLHEDWPDGLYPLRKDFSPTIRPERVPGEWSFPPVRGEGVSEVPVGPVHAGIIEPGHFRFSVVGEVIVDLAVKLFYKHRGIEKMVEGMPFDQACIVVERISGVGSFSHSTAFCQAVERAAGVAAPPRAAALRTVFLELERLYNHVGDIGNLCAGTGLVIGNAQMAILKEQLQQLNERVSGHRYLFGINRPGGVRRDLTRAQREDLHETLDGVEQKFNEVAALILSSSSNMDRLEGTGVLRYQAALDHSVVGPAARASGIRRDCRVEHPHAAYPRVKFVVPVYTQGDVLARTCVRIDEVGQSLSILREVLGDLPGGDIALPLPTVPPYRYALGYTESPRGELLHWLMTGPNNTIYRLKIRSPSFCNWQVVPGTLPGNIVPDFPLINKSFELSYAGNDR